MRKREISKIWSLIYSYKNGYLQLMIHSKLLTLIFFSDTISQRLMFKIYFKVHLFFLQDICSYISLILWNNLGLSTMQMKRTHKCKNHLKRWQLRQWLYTFFFKGGWFWGYQNKYEILTATESVDILKKKNHWGIPLEDFGLHT